MNKLYIFTNHFPYEINSETVFLENELKYLKKHFKHIVIVPTVFTGGYRSFCDYDVDNSFIEGRFSSNHLERILLFQNYYLLREIVYLFLKGNFLKLRRFWWGTDTIVKVLHWYKENQIENSPILLYTFWLTDYTAALSLLKLSKQEIKVISRAHGYDLYDFRNSLSFHPFRELINQGIDNIFFISQHGLNYYSSKYPNSISKLQLAYLGVNEKKFIIGEKKNESYSFVSCSYIRPIKRLKFIANALVTLGGINEDITFVWHHFGGGNDTVQKEIIDLFKCYSNIYVYFHGNVNNSKLLEFYENNYIDLFLSASESEGLPVSMMEAASYSIPIVCIDTGGIKEIVAGEAGLALPQNTSEQEYAIKISSYLFSSNGNNARSQIYKIWKERFSAEKNYNEFCAKLIRIVADEK